MLQKRKLRVDASSKTPVALGDLFAILPHDLLPGIVAASDRPLITYVQLLGISHGIRGIFRGTPHDLSFDLDEPLTADVLAALIGPCKGLVKLSFRSVDIDGSDNPDLATYGCGCTEAACAGWVDEAFAGHDRLAVLEHLPTFYEPVIERILHHLPGLVELRLGAENYISAALLATLARSCPRLQSLRGECSDTYDDLDLKALAPLDDFRTLRAQWIFDERGLSASSNLMEIGRLDLSVFETVALKPLASHLTRVSMARIAEWDPANLPGAWLSQLERLALDGIPFSPRMAELDANRGTLQRLKLELHELTAADLVTLYASLDAMPQLTHLELTGEVPPGTDISTILPTGIYNRLEHLTLGPRGAVLPSGPPLRIVSGRLRRLDLQMLGRLSGLTVDCPALVELRLFEVSTLTLKCPRLRMLQNPPCNWFSALMPDLESVSTQAWDPFWLPDLLAMSTRLRSLPQVRLTRPDLLGLLWAGAASLVDLTLELDLAHMPNPLVLRLPGRLETLRLFLINAGAPLDSQVEAPGLRQLTVSSSGLLRLRLGCPALVAFSARCQGASLELDDQTRLRRLAVKGHCETTSLLDVLTRQGAHLHHVLLDAPEAPSDWPQLAAALSGLPRLANLQLNISNAPPPALQLACPQLRILKLDGADGDQKMVLTSPLLEWTDGCFGHVQLAEPAPNLSHGL
ncbi:hypothetical protein PAPYR_608 [Paratrimastix pyriformis]|uniref:Leucine-rich repeat domain-containing protein n=1 Tax=Paratrimastix pyriformis TaxID=342808 RepID=A0ABQ8UWX1_9EUKA|nr:hypothetical protein PAPYR_608 [Paratrimastix pyriformis]